MESVPEGWKERLRARRERTAALGRQLHERYSSVFWALHSAWALLTGIAVLVLAHNRYGFLRWVVIFLALTWGSTLFFSRFTAASGGSSAMRFAQGVVSYLTRVMYQETLFFLLPFYFYSTTFPSRNSLYVLTLAALAVLSCFDMLFDRLLRENKPFALAFFAFVSFSALQFFLPLVLSLRIDFAGYLGVAISFIAAAALAYPWSELRRPSRLAVLAFALLTIIGVHAVLRPLIPPVPLRLTSVKFGTSLAPRPLKLSGEHARTIPAAELTRGRLYAVATVFSPSHLPARIQVRFVANGDVLRSSRVVDLTASARGFRVWDMLRAPAGGFKPGKYRLEVWTEEGQLVGQKAIEVVAE